MYRLDEHMPSLVCVSLNSLGSDSFVFNVTSSETQLGRGILKCCIYIWLFFCVL